MTTPKKTTAKKSPAKKAADRAPAKGKAATSVSGSRKTTPAKSTAKDPVFEGPLGQALEAVRTPIYAYVGVNDLAIEAVSGIVSDLRKRAEETVAGAQNRVTGAVADGRRQVAEVPERLQAMPAEVNELMARFRPEELRKVAEAYVEVAAGIYNGLAARGEDVVTRLREENPQIEAGFARFNDSVGRAAGAVEDGVEMGEEALGTVARQTRSVGVKAAGRIAKGAHHTADMVDDAAHRTADAVDDAAFGTSDEVQSAAAKVESRTGVAKTPAKKTAATKTPAKKTPAKKTAAKKTPAKKTTTASTATKSTTSSTSPATKSAQSSSSTGTSGTSSSGTSSSTGTSGTSSSN